MSGEQLGFELTEPRPGGVRRTDPATSRAAATDHASMVRWGSQRSALLQAFADAPPGGLLDEEAGARAGITGYNHTRRCAELRQAELIAPTGETRATSSGKAARLCAITNAGKRALMRAFSERDADTPPEAPTSPADGRWCPICEDYTSHALQGATAICEACGQTSLSDAPTAEPDH